MGLAARFSSLLSVAALVSAQQFEEVSNIDVKYNNNKHQISVSWDKVTDAKKYNVVIADAEDGTIVAQRRARKNKKAFPGDRFDRGVRYVVRVRAAASAADGVEASAFSSTVYDHSFFRPQLQGLFSGAEELSTRRKADLLSAHQGDLNEGLLGANFGDSMDLVMGLWGPPNGGWVNQPPKKTTRLYFFRSCELGFGTMNRLVAISIGQADFPGGELVAGLTFGKPVQDLPTLFPEGTPVSNNGPGMSPPGTQIIALDAVIISIQSVDNMLVNIEVRAKPGKPKPNGIADTNIFT